MRRTVLPHAVVAAGLLVSLAACGSDEVDVATDEPTTSVAPTQEVEPVEPSVAPEPSVDPDPAVVTGLELAFDQQALTVTMQAPDLVATDRLLMMYRWQKRDVRVAVETTLVGDEPVLNAVWTDYQTEMSGRIKDVEAAWDLDAGTVTITLRERLNGDQATVAAIGLGPKDRYPVEPPAGAVTETVRRG